MHIIKKNDEVIFRQEHIDPHSGESYYIDHHYSLQQYEEIKRLVNNGN